ncbi:hypothetical protein IQ247_05395 [Plectonema cf. radiosum LEGE 06105]|uniref:Uncharacterized protein n=1 Tax=Plectonema cf. radiosum LEGE 06105 TaxID=945769 RepID=A0A8J7JZM9_9CYAN|nr:hypothetical protein [Plectonema cf. radiosum LEGE 06105]
MNTPDFDSMSREELRQYMLDNRDDKTAFEFYLDKFRNPNSPIYPAPQSLEDMSYLQKIFRQHIADK